MRYFPFLREAARRANSHLAGAGTSGKKSSTMVKQYVVIHVDEEGVEYPTLTEDAYIGKENIAEFKFKFATPEDITDRLKKSGEKPGAGFTGKEGRVAHANATCEYPDGMSSSKIAITGCVADYRPKTNDKRYGVDYVSIGVPEIVFDRITKNAKSFSHMNAGMSPKNTKANGFVWLSLSLEKLGPESVKFVYTGQDGELEQIPIGVNEFMREMESNAELVLFASLSASQTTNSLTQMPDIANGHYNIKLKPAEIFLLGASTVSAPAFGYESQSRERIQVGGKAVASPEAAAMVLKRLTIAK